MINRVIIVGRVVKDAELKTTYGGTSVCKFVLAVNRNKKVGDKWEEETSYIDVQAWAKLAEFASDKLTKGKQITVEGSLRQERWESNGERKQRIIVVADEIEIPFEREDGNGF